jgi:hypothetical protein
MEVAERGQGVLGGGLARRSGAGGIWRAATAGRRRRRRGRVSYAEAVYAAGAAGAMAGQRPPSRSLRWSWRRARVRTGAGVAS